MSHAYHPGLDGYDPDQLLYDGCDECEFRAESLERTLANLDSERFARAWQRAADWQATYPPSGQRPAHISKAEAPLLKALWGVQVHLERLGVPLGQVPDAGALQAAERAAHPPLRVVPPPEEPRL